MFSKRKLLLAAGLSGAAVFAVLNIYVTYARQKNERMQRKAVQRWEGEGGNILPAASVDAAVRAHQDDSAS